MHAVRCPQAEALAATMGIVWDSEEQDKNKEMEGAIVSGCPGLSEAL
jgi:hypothetical protein